MKKSRKIFANQFNQIKSRLISVDKKFFVKYILSGFLLFNIAIWFLVGENFFSTRRGLGVNFLDVGQGNAVYVRAPNGQDVLIDAGSGKQILSQLSGVMPLSDRAIDLIIISHADKDHIGGFSAVLAKYQVKEIWWNGKDKETKTMKELLSAIEQEVKRGALLKVVGASEEKSFACEKNLLLNNKSSNCLFKVRIISPKQPINQEKSANDASIVALVQTPNKQFLLTGDISNQQEQVIMEQNPDLTADVLQVPHHGSKFSSSLKFLKKINPRVSVIQVGKNSYGHPTKETLERLSSINGNKIYRTDQGGRVSFLLFKNNWQIARRR